MKDDEWIKLGPLPGIMIAEMVVEALEEREIPARIAPGFFSSAYGVKSFSGVGQQVYIYVAPDRVAEANEVIDVITNPEASEDE